MDVIWAEQALLPDGWAQNVRITVDQGRIAAVEPGTQAQGQRRAIILPSPVNLHSHAFQRAMAG